MRLPRHKWANFKQLHTEKERERKAGMRRHYHRPAFLWLMLLVERILMAATLYVIHVIHVCGYKVDGNWEKRAEIYRHSFMHEMGWNIIV